MDTFICDWRDRRETRSQVVRLFVASRTVWDRVHEGHRHLSERAVAVSGRNKRRLGVGADRVTLRQTTERPRKERLNRRARMGDGGRPRAARSMLQQRVRVRSSGQAAALMGTFPTATAPVG